MRIDRFDARVQQMVDVLSQIADGNFDRKIVVGTHDDAFTPLEMGINFMLMDLRSMWSREQESFAALEQVNVDLERRVEERTAFLKQLNEELLASQKKLEAARLQADSANRAKSEFLANMSHELRTPLNGILGFAQVILLQKALSDEVRHGVNIIQRSGEHLLLLINDVLDLAKIEARKLELLPDNVVFCSLLESVVELCMVRAHQKGLSFQFEMASDLPRAVRVDQKRMRQLLLNLLGNAVKFTTHGKVTFSVSKLGGQLLRFRIEDTGPGIDPQQIERIFQPFEQIKHSGSAQEGTGLGLAISTRIAELMGGKISVESTVGRGSVFCLDIELPEAVLNEKPVEDKTPIDANGYDGARRTLLVVDDDDVSRSLLTHALESLGFVVIGAADGYAGLAIATREAIDLIITDLAMPGMHGSELIRGIRGIPRYLKTPIIASSASVFAADVNGCLAAGADDFLAKPILLRDLLKKLEKLLSLRWVKRHAEKDRPVDAAWNIATKPTKPKVEVAPAAGHVLVVDDHPINQRILALLLNRHGFVTEVVDSGRAAVAAAKKRRYEMIFMDVELYDLNGIEASRLIRSDEADEGVDATPIIACTAHSLETVRSKCIDAGMNGCVTKPLSAAAVDAEVARWRPRPRSG